LVAHLVLFDVRPELTADERRRFVDSFTQAVDAIPSVRRVTVGRRISVGTSYGPAGDSFGYLALLEFDDETDLHRYLEHPAHAELATLFWAATTRTMVSDFTLAGSDLPLTLASWSSHS
jgi:hypothetical protein